MSHSQRRSAFLRDTANIHDAPADKENQEAPGKLAAPGRLRSGRRPLGQLDNTLPCSAPRAAAKSDVTDKDVTSTAKLPGLQSQSDGIRTPRSAVLTCSATPTPAFAVASLDTPCTLPMLSTAHKQPTWESDLQQYLRLAQLKHPQTASAQLAAAVQSSPASPDAWWRFLQHEEGCQADNQPAAGGCGAELCDLFVWATRLVPRHGNADSPAFLQLWLGLARQRWQRSPDEGREVLKGLKYQHIFSGSAHLCAQWARLEHASGNRSKALMLLRKGLDSGAQPLSVLHALQTELGLAPLSPQQHQLNTHHTACSNLSSGTAFLGPSQHGHAPAAQQKLQCSDVTEGMTATGSHLFTPTLSLHRHGLSGSASAVGKGGETTASLAGSRSLFSARRPLSSLQLGSAESATGGADAEAVESAKAAAEQGMLHGRHDSSQAQQAGGQTSNAAESPPESALQPAPALQAAHKPQHPAKPPAHPACAVPAAPAAESKAAAARPQQRAMRSIPRKLGLGPPARVLSQSEPAEDTADEEQKKRKAADSAHMSPQQLPATAASRLLAQGPKRRQSPDLEEAQAAHQPPMPPPVPRQASKPPPHDLDSSSQPQPHASESKAGARELKAAEAAMQSVSDEETETVPFVYGSLARKALEGRHSLAPPKLAEAGHGRAGAGQQLPAATQRSCDAAAARSHATPQPPAIPAGKVALHQTGLRCSTPTDKLMLREPSSLPDVPGSNTTGGTARQRPLPPPPPPGYGVTQAQPPRLADSAAAGQLQPSRVQREEPAQPMELVEAVQKPRPVHAQAPSVSSRSQAPPEEAGAKLRTAAGNAQQTQAEAQRHAAAGEAAAQSQRKVAREDENYAIVRGTKYTKLECVGKGGSSKVFKVMSPLRKIYALKRIRLTGRDAEAAAGFIDEIRLLQRLRNQPNIIQLVDAEVVRAEGLIYMVLEYGDIDLARLLDRRQKARAQLGCRELDGNFIRLYWQQMLQAVAVIHEARIVHSDLKPANFLVVEGQLKLIDFGIAKAIKNDTTSIVREAQVGTLNYMAPEAILGGSSNIRGAPPMKVGRPSDIWSLGCILYQMAYGHTPFAALPFVAKMHAITDPGHAIAFLALPDHALLDVLQRCLLRNARSRITMPELLSHPFLQPSAGSAPAAAEQLPRGAGSVGLTKEQLKSLVAHVSQAGSSADVESLSEQLFRQLAEGDAAGLGSLLSQPSAGRQGHPAQKPTGPPTGPPPPPPPPKLPTVAPPQPPKLPSKQLPALGEKLQTHKSAPHIPSAHDLSREGQEPTIAAVKAGSSRPAASVPVAEAAAREAAQRAARSAQAVSQLEAQRSRQHLSALQEEIKAGRAVLKHRDVGSLPQKKPAEAETGLEARLREGIARFRFDDTHGMTQHSSISMSP